jgi:hypothetical protein
MIICMIYKYLDVNDKIRLGDFFPETKDLSNNHFYISILWNTLSVLPVMSNGIFSLFSRIGVSSGIPVPAGEYYMVALANWSTPRSMTNHYHLIILSRSYGL